MTDTKVEKRISMRVGEHLISFRLEEGNLDDVDYLARHKGISRS